MGLLCPLGAESSLPRVLLEIVGATVERCYLDGQPIEGANEVSYRKGLYLVVRCEGGIKHEWADAKLIRAETRILPVEGQAFSDLRTVLEWEVNA